MYIYYYSFKSITGFLNFQKKKKTGFFFKKNKNIKTITRKKRGGNHSRVKVRSKRYLKTGKAFLTIQKSRPQSSNTWFY
jgi:hypothetical protein